MALLRRHAVLFAILLGAFTLVLTNSAFNLLLPYFIEYYDISTTAGGWIIALYMLAMTLTMPLASLIVDRLGRKRTYMMGICIYGVFSVIGALFHSYIEALLLVRFMHGVAAGLMIPLSLVLLFDVYGPEVRGRITGAWGLLLMLAPAAGPTLGGFIIQYGRLEILAECTFGCFFTNRLWTSDSGLHPRSQEKVASIQCIPNCWCSGCAQSGCTGVRQSCSSSMDTLDIDCPWCSVAYSFYSGGE